MKYAVVEGERQEAEPGLSGKCPFCSNAMIAKCGEQRDWHWAHRGTRTCDHWWEPETPWHRAWKNRFPEVRQEIIHLLEDGEKHIADVKTESGMVIEFQHSFLRPDERKSRDIFYKKMVWVVDGVRRKRDRAQFFTSVRTAIVVSQKPMIVSVQWNEGALPRDWEASNVPVYFDFPDTPILWRLNPGAPNSMTYLSQVPKNMFLGAHLGGLPLEGIVSESVELAASRYLQASRLKVSNVPWLKSKGPGPRL
jgi:hypothetical protein